MGGFGVEEVGDWVGEEDEDGEIVDYVGEYWVGLGVVL